MHVDLVIVGGGPAGLAAAIAAKEAGVSDLIIIEREEKLGGILNQCIHNGFGLHTFNEELTGPEYAGRYVDQVLALKIPYLLDTMIIDIAPDKKITAVNSGALIEIQAKSIILAMGCRERPRGALNIPGSRPVGIYTAGTAQYFVNRKGYMPGKEIVILGSGDIGLIMARRMTLEGAKVNAVIELMPYSGGLKRNIVQCLNDYDIPLLLSHTVTEIIGKDRVEGVKIAQVDAKRQPIADTQRLIPCDTLLLSVGLLPENELSKGIGVALSDVTGGPIVNEQLATNIAGVFACGNVLHVHDLVDYVSEESALAGLNAANYLKQSQADKAAQTESKNKEAGIVIIAENGVRYTVPATINPAHLQDAIKIRFRVDNVYQNHFIVVKFDNHNALQKKRPVLLPAEMESISLTKELLNQYPGAHQITVCLQEDA